MPGISSGRRIPFVLVTLLTVVAPAAGAATVYVAGVEPHQRPANAPTITTVAKNTQWYDRALTGVEPPYPASFRFLEDQGNWYTPFNRPGMTGPYDLRGWHQ